MEGILMSVEKRKILKIVSRHMKIIYDRGYYWKVDWDLLTPYKTRLLLKTRPADDYAEILTLVEGGKFITLINFKDFDTYSYIDGITPMEDGVYRELPEIEKTNGSSIMGYLPDVYNRIYGFWKVSSHFGDEEDTIEILYNNHQETAYYIIYKKDRAIILSPITSFIIHNPQTPKIIGLTKDQILGKEGFYGFFLWEAAHQIAKLAETNPKLKKSLGGEIRFEPLSNTAEPFQEEQPVAPFIDGETPIYASPFGFYRGKRSEFDYRKTTTHLSDLVEPTYYRKGDFEMKIFDDLTYAVRYGEYLLLPCCLAKLKEPIELEAIHSSEAAAEEIPRAGYKYATEDPARYTARMEFKVPHPFL